MENNKRKRWQNGKVLMAGVLSAAMILQPMTVLAADTQADETEKKVVPSEAEIAALWYGRSDSDTFGYEVGTLSV